MKLIELFDEIHTDKNNYKLKSDYFFTSILYDKNFPDIPIKHICEKNITVSLFKNNNDKNIEILKILIISGYLKYLCFTEDIKYKYIITTHKRNKENEILLNEQESDMVREYFKFLNLDVSGGIAIYIHDTKNLKYITNKKNYSFVCLNNQDVSIGTFKID